MWAAKQLAGVGWQVEVSLHQVHPASSMHGSQYLCLWQLGHVCLTKQEGLEASTHFFWSPHQAHPGSVIQVAQSVAAALQYNSQEWAMRQEGSLPVSMHLGVPGDPHHEQPEFSRQVLQSVNVEHAKHRVSDQSLNWQRCNYRNFQFRSNWVHCNCLQDSHILEWLGTICTLREGLVHWYQTSEITYQHRWRNWCNQQSLRKLSE